MTILYRLVGGRREPVNDERLEIEDEQFTMWRSVGTAIVGRFAGRLPDATARELAAAAEQARLAAVLRTETPPDAPIETVDLGDGKVTRLGQGDESEGPWAVLVRRLRTLADELLDQPTAAIALEVADDGRSARLVHRGNQPVGIDLSAVRVAAYAWKGYYEPAGRWKLGPIAVAGADKAEPGWNLELPFDHDLTLGRGRSLQVAVDFALKDGDTWRAVSAAHVPVIKPPTRRKRA